MPRTRTMVNVVDVESPWLDHEGLARYLGGVSDEWIKAHVVNDLHVHIRKVGRKFFFRKAEIDRLIERNRIT